MLSETLSEGLEAYSIGPKVRALRLRKKMGLVELGRHTGLSPAMLSKVERGRLFPTLPTLLRIALVFSVGLDHFFMSPRERPTVAVVRRGERRRFPDRAEAAEVSYHFECLDYPATDRRMNSYYCEFEAIAADHATPHQHVGAEMVYVVSGRLVITIGDEAHTLDRGDAIYFDANRPHSYRRTGTAKCAAVVVTA